MSIEEIAVTVTSIKLLFIFCPLLILFDKVTQ
jgi:hypothetical protein